MISVFGYCIGAAALIIVLSVFNGIEDLFTGIYNQFDPDIMISPTKGKTFVLNEELTEYLNQNPDIIAYSKVLEEQVLLRYNGKESSAKLKGVSDSYSKVNGIDSLMYRGNFVLTKGDTNGAVMGMGLAYTVGAGLKFINALVVYAPKRIGNISLASPQTGFSSTYYFPTGFFVFGEAEVDNEYMIVGLKTVQDLFQYQDEISSIEIKLQNYENRNLVKKQLKDKFGNNFTIKDRYEQNIDFYRMQSMEKWISSLIAIFILIIAIFNIIATLSMLILEKKNDISTLQSIGADKTLIREIFNIEGGLIAFFGGISGIIVGLIACFLQQQFGIIKMGSGGQFIVDAYPIIISPYDILFTFVVVIVVGIVSVYLSVNHICKRFKL